MLNWQIPEKQQAFPMLIMLFGPRLFFLNCYNIEDCSKLYLLKKLWRSFSLTESKMKSKYTKKEQRMNIIFSQRLWFTKYSAYDDQTRRFCFSIRFLFNARSWISVWPIKAVCKSSLVLSKKQFFIMTQR